MQDRYELIDAFPTSLSKYEVSLIATTLEGQQVNPCDVLYEKEDNHPDESIEDIVERFAFEEQERLQLYLDAKNHFFKSRRVEPILLTNYLKKKYDYDSVHMSEFQEDKNALFNMLFHENYKPQKNELKEDFVEARAASHKFKEKRDRMTHVEDKFDLEEVQEKIPEFEEIMNTGDKSPTVCESYYSGGRETLTILVRQEHRRKKIPTFEFRESASSDKPTEPEVTYVEQYPIRENAVQLKNVDTGTEIQVYSSVNPWDETLMRLFTTIIEMDVVSKLAARQSATAKKIMEDVKEQAGEGDSTPADGVQVQNIVSDHVAEAAEKVKESDTTLSEEFVEQRLSSTMVTGVYVDGEETTFEVHADNGIYSLLEEYEGMAASLAQAVASADIDDITIYAKVPSNTDEDDEIVLENGEWYMSSNSSESTLKALEAALR